MFYCRNLRKLGCHLLVILVYEIIVLEQLFSNYSPLKPASKSSGVLVKNVDLRLNPKLTELKHRIFQFIALPGSCLFNMRPGGTYIHKTEESLPTTADSKYLTSHPISKLMTLPPFLWFMFDALSIMDFVKDT